MAEERILKIVPRFLTGAWSGIGLLTVIILYF